MFAPTRPSSWGPQRCDNGQSRRSRAARPGFTLVETIVVIAIIALLMSLLLPSLKRSMRLAASTVCMHNLQQIGYAIEMYRMDNAGWLPHNEAIDSEQDGRAVVAPWFVKLLPVYLGDGEALTCPEDPLYRRWRHKPLPTPDAIDPDQGVQPASYGLNGFMLHCGDGYLADPDRRPPTRPLDTLLAADLGPDGTCVSATNDDPTPPTDRNYSVLSWDDNYDPFGGQVQDPWITARHGRGINMLTLGGGVRSVRTIDIIDEPILDRYDSCVAGGCTLCTEFEVPHYTFARDRIFWWTGRLAGE